MNSLIINKFFMNYLINSITQKLKNKFNNKNKQIFISKFYKLYD